MRPYDMTTFCLAEFMGVELLEAKEPLNSRLERIERGITKIVRHIALDENTETQKTQNHRNHKSNKKPL